jgi:hypothetical protein
VRWSSRWILAAKGRSHLRNESPRQDEPGLIAFRPRPDDLVASRMLGRHSDDTKQLPFLASRRQTHLSRRDVQGEARKRFRCRTVKSLKLSARKIVSKEVSWTLKVANKQTKALIAPPLSDARWTTENWPGSGGDPSSPPGPTWQPGCPNLGKRRDRPQRRNDGCDHRPQSAATSVRA